MFADSIRAKADAYSAAWLDAGKRNTAALLKAQKVNAAAIDAQNRVAVAVEKSWNDRQVGYLEQAAALASS